MSSRNSTEDMSSHNNGYHQHSGADGRSAVEHQQQGETSSSSAFSSEERAPSEPEQTVEAPDPAASLPLAANDLELDMTTNVEASTEAGTLLGTGMEPEIMAGRDDSQTSTLVNVADPDDQPFSLTSYYAAGREELFMTASEREHQGSLTGSWIETVVPAGNPNVEMRHEQDCTCRRCRRGFRIR